MLFKEPAVIQISHYYNCYGHIKVLLGSFLLAPYVSSNKSHETDWWDGRGLLLDSKPASLFLSLVYEQQLLRSWASCRLIYSQIQIRCPVRLDWPPRATCLNAKQSISDAAFSDLLTYSKQTAQCPACRTSAYLYYTVFELRCIVTSNLTTPGRKKINWRKHSISVKTPTVRNWIVPFVCLNCQKTFTVDCTL